MLLKPVVLVYVNKHYLYQLKLLVSFFVLSYLFKCIKKSESNNKPLLGNKD